MIMSLHAARFTEFMHGTSFFEIQRNSQVVRASASHIRLPSLRLLCGPTLRDHGLFRREFAERSLRRGPFSPKINPSWPAPPPFPPPCHPRCPLRLAISPPIISPLPPPPPAATPSATTPSP